jgi:hypothetical protein
MDYEPSNISNGKAARWVGQKVYELQSDNDDIGLVRDEAGRVKY